MYLMPITWEDLPQIIGKKWYVCIVGDECPRRARKGDKLG